MVQLGFTPRMLPRLVVLFLALHLATPALRATIRDGGIDPLNLGKGDWIYILPNAINQMGGTMPSVQFTDTLTNETKRFYRVRGLP